jgi:glyoxylase-like metal-dependent hydrolase (beta-lactamase superfamily II)
MAATHHLLHAGYARDDGVSSSVSLVLDGGAKIVVDPGMVADRGLILDPLRALGVEPEQVTHVVITHHHPDHTVNIGLFPNAEGLISGPGTVATSGLTTRGRATGSASTAAWC